MKKKITITTEHAEVSEVKACWNQDEANELLKTKQWFLLHGCVAHRDQMGFQANPCWLLGKKAS